MQYHSKITTNQDEEIYTIGTIPFNVPFVRADTPPSEQAIYVKLEYAGKTTVVCLHYSDLIVVYDLPTIIGVGAFDGDVLAPFIGELTITITGEEK